MSDLRELPALRKRAFELAIPAECRDLAIRVAEVIKTRDDFDRGQQDEPLRRVIDYLPHARNVLDVFAASGLLVDPPEVQQDEPGVAGVVCWKCAQAVVRVVDDGIGPELVRSWCAALDSEKGNDA